jgi:peroxiredoxin (alkyl hydroperoxide reductase subunit C)
MIGVGDKFPEFELTGVSGNQSNLKEDWPDADHDFITVKSWQLKDWSVIYFYPKDFTFICPTEIVGMDNLMSETDEVYGISPDNEYCKWNWKCEQGDHSDLYGTIHPLLADCNNVLAEELGIVNEDEGVPYRATYIVDPEGVIQHLSINALNTGRNANEILRTLQALKAGGLTGCEWNPGDDFVA